MEKKFKMRKRKTKVINYNSKLKLIQIKKQTTFDR